jgi:nucleoside-diphosphate-sugar epimerase
MYQSKKVLVTGAGGYIGRHVVKTLLDQGIRVLAVDLTTDNVDKRAETLQLDIFSGSKNIYEEIGSPDICLHLAWKDGFLHNSSAHIDMLSSHYVFLTNMLSGGLKHLAVMGTMHEIGYYEGEINDDTPTNPLSLYGVAKNSLRQSLSILLKDSNVVFQWLRAFYIYGDDINNHSVFTKIIESENKNLVSFPLTSGTNKCDYISIDELARQITAAITQTRVTGIINCCSGHATPLKDIVNDFVTRNNFKIKLQWGVYPVRAYDSPAIWGNNRNISDILHNSAV